MRMERLPKKLLIYLGNLSSPMVLNLNSKGAEIQYEHH